MTLERALINQAGSHIVANKLRNFIRAEINKGCSSNIASHPVSLEPNFNPIWAAIKGRDVQDMPDYSMVRPASAKDLVRRQIWISPDQKFDWNNSELFIKQVQTTSFGMGFEVSGNSNKIMINFLCHRFDLPIINASFQGVFEYCELSDVTDNPLSGLPAKMWQGHFFRDYFPHPPYYNLLTCPPELKTSPLKPLIIALSDIPAPTVGFFQILLQPVHPEHNWHRNIMILSDFEYAIKLQSGLQIPNRYLQQAPSGDLRHMAMDLESKAHNDKPFYATAVRVGIVGGGNGGQNLLRSISAFVSLFQHGGRSLAYITQDRYKQVLISDKIQDMFKLGLVYRPGFLVNSWELASLINIPPLRLNEPRRIPLEALETLPVHNPKLLSGTCIGICNYAGTSQRVCLPDKIRKSHLHVIGSTGKGKTTLLEHTIMSDIEQGHGIALFDPHGDIVQRILCFISEKHIDRVIYFDPGYPGWVFLWNVFVQMIFGQGIGRLTDGIILGIQSFVSSTGWGDRMENIYRNLIFSLMHLPGSNFLDLYNLLRNDSSESEVLRQKILELVDNQAVRQFWEDDYKKYRKEEFGPPKNKLSKLLVSEPSVSLMLSQPENRINFTKIMDEGMILLVNLSTIGPMLRSVLGCFILSNLHFASLNRSSAPIEKRKQFHIYIDEAHRFMTDALEDLIAETRKFNVSLNIAHQYLSQFGKRKQDALSTVGSTIIFNVDKTDAGYLSKDLRGLVSKKDLVSLEVGEAIARIDTDIIRLKALPPMKPPSTNFRDRIISESIKKYYEPVHEVKKWIKQPRNKSYSSALQLSFTPEKKPGGEIKEFEYDEFETKGQS
jgi:hypothetical protein